MQDQKKHLLVRIVLDFERGKAVSQIAQEHGITPYYVNKWLTDEGYKQKRKGKDSFAIISRAREMRKRGWPMPEIAALLGEPEAKVQYWLTLSADPTRAGGRSAIKLRGKPLNNYRNKRKANPSKKGWKRIHTKKPKVKEKDLPYVDIRNDPPKHERGKRWSLEAEAYVLEMLKSGDFTIREIYDRTRASRRQQLRIWRRYRGKSGFPPAWPKITPEEAAKILAARQAGDEGTAQEVLEQVELRAVEQAQRRAELEEEISKEEAEIQKLEKKASKLRAQRQQRAIQGRIAESDATAPRLRLGADRGKWSDNGRYFAVSNDWHDLSKATTDELEAFAWSMSESGFPSRAEGSGDQPAGYFNNEWPSKLEKEWNGAVSGSLKFLGKYKKQRSALRKNKMRAEWIEKYLEQAYAAFGNTELSKRDKAKLVKRLEITWGRLKPVQKAILMFEMKSADPNGLPTQEGVLRGRLAAMGVKKAKPATAALPSVQERKTPSLEEGYVPDTLALGEGNDDDD